MTRLDEGIPSFDASGLVRCADPNCAAASHSERLELADLDVDVVVRVTHYGTAQVYLCKRGGPARFVVDGLSAPEAAE